jgi:hypothetical protein
MVRMKEEEEQPQLKRRSGFPCGESHPAVVRARQRAAQKKAKSERAVARQRAARAAARLLKERAAARLPKQAQQNGGGGDAGAACADGRESKRKSEPQTVVAAAARPGAFASEGSKALKQEHAAPAPAAPAICTRR